MAGKNYQDLIAWQKAIDLVLVIYQISNHFPKEEIYGLRAQIRKAAVSIPSNIAEGQGRKTKPDFRNFLSITYGSLRELETQVIIAQRLDYIDNIMSEEVMNLANQVGRLINGLSQSLTRTQ
jgi:four helix bundle protein